MVGVQEREGTMTKDEENCVQQLVKLCEVIQVVQKLDSLGPGVGVADTIEDTVFANNRNQLLGQQQQQSQAQQSQNEVVELEDGVEPDRPDRFEQKLATEDHHVVQDDSGRNCRHRRHGNIGIELVLEPIHVLARDLENRLAEKRVELNSERALEGRGGDFPQIRGGFDEMGNFCDNIFHCLLDYGFGHLIK